MPIQEHLGEKDGGKLQIFWREEEVNNLDLGSHNYAGVSCACFRLTLQCLSDFHFTTRKIGGYTQKHIDKHIHRHASICILKI